MNKQLSKGLNVYLPVESSFMNFLNYEL